MTRSRFYILRLGQAFGIKFTSKHGAAAANESHLLRDAEEILGSLVWRDLENVEALSMEYWRLRKLTKEHDTLLADIADAQNILSTSHNKRAAYLEEVVGSTKELVDEREKLLGQYDRLTAERDLILGEARSIKRRHDGIKAKLEVLAEEGKSDEDGYKESEEELLGLKKRFRSLRTRRDEVTTDLSELEKAMEDLDKDIEERRSKAKTESSEDFDNISKANRDISLTRGKINQLEDEIQSLLLEVGRHLCENQDDPEVADLLRPHRRLISQIKILRDSVHMNRILGRRYKDPA